VDKKLSVSNWKAGAGTSFGPVREKQEKIMKSMPLYTNLYTAWIESNVNFQSVFTEAMKRTFEQTAEKLSESTKSGKLNMSPEIGKDLYKTWIDAYSEDIPKSS